ncbi:MAG: DMT family transporter [Zoogloeaceae bacterium]|nr:DMT family transporter [Zoogloeaceae bacterium]
MSFGAVNAKPFLFASLGGVLFAGIWSGAFIATKIGLDDMQPLWLAQTRLAMAGLIFFLLTRAETIRFWKTATPGRWITVLVSGILSQAVYLGATYWALTLLSAGAVAIVVAALPLIAVPMGALLLRERIAVVDVGAALVGGIGVVIVALGRDAAPLNDTNLAALPVLMTFIAVLALAAGNALIKPCVNLRTIGPICATQMIVSSVVLLPVALYFHGQFSMTFSAQGMGAFCYLVLAGSVLGTYVWLKVLKFFTSKSASLFFLLTPVFSLFIGYFLLNEPLTPQKLVGAALISGSILVNACWYLRRGRAG